MIILVLFPEKQTGKEDSGRCVTRKHVFGVSDQDTNQHAQLQRLVRILNCACSKANEHAS